MPGLESKIQDALHDAMRARDETRKSTLRMLTAAIKNASIEARKPLDDDAVTAVIQRQVKQRRESIFEFRKGNREDLASNEEAELVILEAYLPAQATPADIEAAARRVIAETGAAGPRDIGKVMPALTREFAGLADGRLISEIVRGLLGS